MVRWYRSSRRYRRALLLLAAAAAVAVPVPLALGVGQQVATSRARQRVAGVAAEVEQHVAGILERAFEDLHRLDGRQLSVTCDDTTRRALGEVAYRSGIYREVGLIDASAHVRCTNQLVPEAPLDIAPDLREPVLQALAGGREAVFGGVEHSRYEGVSIAAGVPRSDGGAVYVLVHPRLLVEPFRGLALGATGRVVVRDQRGDVMSAFAHGLPAPADAVPAAEPGSFRHQVRHDGGPAPYSVEVAVSPDRLTGAWRQDRRWVLAGGLLVSASLLVAVWIAARRGMSFVTDLRTALARDELEVRYQPIFDLESGTCTGCEALVRWRHPERGPVEPDLFVPLAEGAGLIEAVTDFVVDRALDEIGATLRERPHMELGFNVSAPMLGDEQFLQALADRVRRAGVRPEQVVLEVTEREVVDSGDRAVVDRLNELRRHGFRLGLDDFGIGYSTLGFLRDGGFEVLKVDRSFVAAIGSDNPFASLVDRIVEIGRSFNLEVIAEGIEREDQLEHLQSLGCPRGQGFLLSGPVKAETLIEGVKAGCRRGGVDGGGDDLAG